MSLKGINQEGIGGPGRDRTDDLFHAMEARSQLRHRPTDKLLLVYTSREFRPTLRLRSLRATVERPGASVESMDCSFFFALPLVPRMFRKIFYAEAILVLSWVLSGTNAVALQTSVPVNVAMPATTASEASINDTLQPALNQVEQALGRVQIDHWKLSRDQKQQLSGDATSIAYDLGSQLPGLFEAVRQSPAALAPQFNVLHNVDALYDVLVRITTTAGLTAGRSDAAILDDALQGLESARKAAAARLLQAASLRDQQYGQIQAQVAATQGSNGSDGAKKIVVNNRVGVQTQHHKTTHRKPSSANGTAASSPATTP